MSKIPKELLPYLTLVTKLGLLMVGSIFIGFGIGMAADKLLHTSPILSIIGIILGVVAGFYSLYRYILKIDSLENK